MRSSRLRVLLLLLLAGGPLLDPHGLCIGINIASRLTSDRLTLTGLGWAVPIDTVRWPLQSHADLFSPLRTACQWIALACYAFGRMAWKGVREGAASHY